MAGKAIEITDSNFEQEVKKSQIPVLVDFWAPWCGPCLRMTPIIEEIAGEFEGKIKVGKINVDDNNKTAEEFRITSIPTLIIFKNGKKEVEVIGARPKDNLVEIINKVL